MTGEGGNTSWSGFRASAPRGAREAVHKRDEVCVRCGSGQDLQVDHVKSVVEARLLGWTTQEIDSVNNLQLLCGSCHREKTNAEVARGLARRRERLAPPVRKHPGLL